MKNGEIAALTDSLLPALYNFAYGLVPDELQAEQLVVDAYSVFLIREGELLQDAALSDSDPKVRAHWKRFIQTHMIQDILALGAKRCAHLASLFSQAKSEKPFYGLELNQRAALLLKENMKFGHKDLAQALSLEKHQVVELLHNARSALIHHAQAAAP